MQNGKGSKGTMAYETIIVEIEDEIALIRLNRPEALNALNATLLEELSSALTEADRNDKVRCIVLTGSEKAFAAGADIKEMSDKSFVDVSDEDLFGAQIEQITRVRKPLIAAVSGYALGGGCELAMVCDFIICAENAKFGQPEIKLGVAPGMGGSQRLTKAVGKSKAMEMCLTGRMMDAEEAERSNLVARVVPHDTLLDEALKTAAQIASMPPMAAIANKEMVNAAFETSLDQGLIIERRIFQILAASEDKAEGMAAFVEKREGKWKGR